MWITILLVFVVVLIFSIYSCRKPKGYPPGPIWLPLVGCWPLMRKLHLQHKHIHLAALALHEIYGPVVGLKLGFHRVVLVSGYNAVREVCLNETYDGRPDGLFFRLRSFGERLGIVFVDGQFQKEQKRYSLNLLRKLGFGFFKMHELIRKEATELANIIEANCEKPLEINHLLDVHTVNVIWTLMAGYRFSSDDHRLLQLLKLVHRAFQISEMSGGVLNQLPFLKYIAPRSSGYSTLSAFVEDLSDFMNDILQKHDPSDKQNFISIYLEKIKENEGIKNTTYTRKQLMMLMEDLFMAGTETTSSTLTFLLHYLMMYPEVQKNIQAELDRELGIHEIPTMEHRNRLIYLEATIMEVQRMSMVVPLTLPHRAIQDSHFMGYNIPEDTILLPNLWSIHMDESYWKDPQAFRPERFIDPRGKLIQSSHFIPFGVGRRKCLGEVLARDSLFMFSATILNRFELQLPENAEPAKIVDGMTMTLTPLKIKFISRTVSAE